MAETLTKNPQHFTDTSLILVLHAFDTLAVYRMAVVSATIIFKVNEQSIGKLFGRVLVDAGLRDQPLCQWTPTYKTQDPKVLHVHDFSFFSWPWKSKIFQ